MCIRDSFNTDSKPWPFNDKNEDSDLSDLNEEIESVEVEPEEVSLDNEQPS